MKIILLSIFAACFTVASAVPGNDADNLNKRDTTQTIESLHLIQVNKEISFTFTSTRTFFDVHTKTKTNTLTEYHHSPTKLASLSSLWPVLESASSVTSKKTSATFPWPAVDFTDSSRGHGSSPPWPVVTDFSRSKNSEPSDSWSVADMTKSSGPSASWPDVQVTHITRSRGHGFSNIVPGIDYIDITRSRGLYPSPSINPSIKPNFYEANYNEDVSFWRG